MRDFSECFLKTANTFPVLSSISAEIFSKALDYPEFGAKDIYFWISQDAIPLVGVFDIFYVRFWVYKTAKFDVHSGCGDASESFLFAGTRRGILRSAASVRSVTQLAGLINTHLPSPGTYCTNA